MYCAYIMESFPRNAILKGKTWKNAPRIFHVCTWDMRYHGIKKGRRLNHSREKAGTFQEGGHSASFPNNRGRLFAKSCSLRGGPQPAAGRPSVAGTGAAYYGSGRAAVMGQK
jgi:hypothetical protein